MRPVIIRIATLSLLAPVLVGTTTSSATTVDPPSGGGTVWKSVEFRKGFGDDCVGFAGYKFTKKKLRYRAVLNCDIVYPGGLMLETYLEKDGKTVKKWNPKVKHCPNFKKRKNPWKCATKKVIKNPSGKQTWNISTRFYVHDKATFEWVLHKNLKG